MTLSNRRMLHNYNFNNRIPRKEMKVPVYQFESDGDSDFSVKILGGIVIVFITVVFIALFFVTIWPN